MKSSTDNKQVDDEYNRQEWLNMKSLLIAVDPSPFLDTEPKTLITTATLEEELPVKPISRCQIFMIGILH